MKHDLVAYVKSPTRIISSTIYQTFPPVNGHSLSHDMHFSSKSFVPNSPFTCVPNTLLRPNFISMVDGGHMQPTLFQANIQMFSLKIIPRVCTFTHSIPKVHCTGTFQFTVNVEESSEIGHLLRPQLNRSSSLEQTDNEEVTLDKNEEHILHKVKEGLRNKAGGRKSIGKKSYKEIQRRRKIGMANKGKIPWNKGRKHNAETRERIKRRTIEALRDPKVRKKMSKCPRAHSDQSKARIGIALRRIWGERLKQKRSQEKFYLKWAERIAEEAKKGGHDQEELDWDSYEKMKTEIILQQLHRAADKARAKEIARVRAERAAKAKANKMARLAKERKEKEQKVKTRGESKKNVRKKLEKEKEGLAISKGLIRKARLTKMHRQKSREDQTTCRKVMPVGGLQPAIEKWDLEFIEREKVRREVSLVDQIRAAKEKRQKLLQKKL